ncbi:hypothetical protein ACFYOV_25765 [Streptomyces sp. NPDC005931]|uniref:hypothetical protein n=1 Tax=Streptomyces sp. NPDC005931 TaxID=3364737 RepID=UPI00368AD056
MPQSRHALGVTAAIGPERVGVRLSPGLTGTAPRRAAPTPSTRPWPALAGAPAGLGLGYRHLWCTPTRTHPLFHRIRAAWPGTLIADPVLPEPTTEAVPRAAERLPSADADLIALGRPILPIPTRCGGCGWAHH